MTKKEKKSGLGRGLDSLIPKIEEKEVEEGTSLEDIINSKKTDEKVQLQKHHLLILCNNLRRSCICANYRRMSKRHLHKPLRLDKIHAGTDSLRHSES